MRFFNLFYQKVISKTNFIEINFVETNFSKVITLDGNILRQIKIFDQNDGEIMAWK